MYRNSILSMLFILLGACMTGTSRVEMGNDVVQANVEKIIPGVTAKSQVLEIFGPPLALARKDTAIFMPSKQGRDSSKVDSATLFELFSTQHKLTAQHIVYYYDNTHITGETFAVMFAISTTQKSLSNRLWVLINNETGIVEDYVYRAAQ